MTPGDLSHPVWRKSSRSPGNGGDEKCVELAALDDGRIAVRDSKHPDGAVLVFPRAGLTAWIGSVRDTTFTPLS